jgi:predicted NBD/HSP70 family sugar kinase
MLNTIISEINLDERSRNILGLIQKKGPISKFDMQSITELKLTTLNRITAPLESLQFIEEASIGTSTGGRKPILYDINKKSCYSIGIDLSRTYTQVIITNFKAELLYKYHFAMDENCTPEKTVENIVNGIIKGINELEINESHILGIGVGTVGPISRENGVILNPENFIAPGWKNVSLKKMLGSRLPIPVIVDNGANTAVLAEYLFGFGKGVNVVSYFNCGVGIRSGIVSSGLILRTLNDIEDAFGHMLVDIDGEKCFCGNYGCIETYCSIPSIVKSFISHLKRGRETLIQKQIEQISFDDICDAEEKGDLLAKEVLTSAATVFGAGLSNYINLLSPEMVILSGPIISRCNLFFKVCTEIAMKKCYVKKTSDIYIHKQGAFGDNAISIGAACLVIENFLGDSH